MNGVIKRLEDEANFCMKSPRYCSIRTFDILEDARNRIKELEAENHKLKLTMQLHAGDCCSLNNEVELFRGHWEDAENECKKLKTKLELAMSQDYCTMCGNILDGYVPPKERK